MCICNIDHEQSGHSGLYEAARCTRQMSSVGCAMEKALVSYRCVPAGSEKLTGRPLDTRFRKVNGTSNKALDTRCLMNSSKLNFVSTRLKTVSWLRCASDFAASWCDCIWHFVCRCAGIVTSMGHLLRVSSAIWLGRVIATLIRCTVIASLAHSIPLLAALLW